MKIALKTLLACLVLTGLIVVSSCQTGDTKKETTQAKKEKVVAKKYKMTTEIPASIPIADEVETRF